MGVLLGDDLVVGPPGDQTHGGRAVPLKGEGCEDRIVPQRRGDNLGASVKRHMSVGAEGLVVADPQASHRNVTTTLST